MGGRVSKYSKLKVGSIYKTLPILRLYKNKNGSCGADFKCICNKIFSRNFSNIEKGSLLCNDCGRYKRNFEKSKYIVKDRRLYRIWKCMNHRCNNSTDSNYDRYGGRGIKVCDDWLETNQEGFNNFYRDMGFYPTVAHTLDRNNGDLGYWKENCSWESQKTQMNNVSTNHMIHWEGTDYTLQQLGELLGIKPNTILTRLRRGYPLEQAVMQNPTYQRVRGEIKKKGSYSGGADINLIRKLLKEGKTRNEISVLTGSSTDIIGRLERVFLNVDRSIKLRGFNNIVFEVTPSFKYGQEDIDYLIHMKESGYSNTKISKILGCSNSTVGNLLKRINYEK